MSCTLPELPENPAKLLELINSHRITIISVFPYLLQELDKLPVPPNLRLAISGGDVLRPGYAPSISAKIPVYNTYGP